jgi:hypothetical protein
MKTWIISLLIILLVFSSCSKNGRQVAEKNTNESVTDTVIREDTIVKTDIGQSFTNIVFEGDLIINLPQVSEGIVEKIGETVYYGSGAIFTASLVSGDNNHSVENISWEILDKGYKRPDLSRTTINNGFLSVVPSDHGETLTIIATLNEMHKSSTIDIRVAYCFPSHYYGTWVMETDNYTITTIITNDTFEIKNDRVMVNNTHVPYHYKTSIRYWSCADFTWGSDNYPVGYTIYSNITQILQGDMEIGDSFDTAFYLHFDKNTFISGGFNVPINENHFYLKQL